MLVRGESREIPAIQVRVEVKLCENLKENAPFRHEFCLRPTAFLWHPPTSSDFINKHLADIRERMSSPDTQGTYDFSSFKFGLSCSLMPLTCFV